MARSAICAAWTSWSTRPPARSTCEGSDTGGQRRPDAPSYRNAVCCAGRAGDASKGAVLDSPSDARAGDA